MRSAEGRRGVRTIHYSVLVSGSSCRLLCISSWSSFFLLSDLWMNSLTLKRWKLEFTSPKHLCCEWVPSCFPCQRQQHDQINFHFHHQPLSRLSYLCPGMPGHIHHIQWCVTNLDETLLTLHRFGFRRFTYGQCHVSFRVMVLSLVSVLATSAISSGVKNYTDSASTCSCAFNYF